MGYISGSSLYEFVQSDPANQADPLGLVPYDPKLPPRNWWDWLGLAMAGPNPVDPGNDPGLANPKQPPPPPDLDKVPEMELRRSHPRGHIYFPAQINSTIPSSLLDGMERDNPSECWPSWVIG